MSSREPFLAVLFAYNSRRTAEGAETQWKEKENSRRTVEPAEAEISWDIRTVRLLESWSLGLLDFLDFRTLDLQVLRNLRFPSRLQ